MGRSQLMGATLYAAWAFGATSEDAVAPASY